MVWRSICAVILADGPANSGQLTHAVTTAGPMVPIGAGIGWLIGEIIRSNRARKRSRERSDSARTDCVPTRYESLPVPSYPPCNLRA
jgi:hypothetical protein